MKPLLYIAAALMIGAAIYGFVDFKKKSHSKEFQSLYTKEATKDVKEQIPAPDVPERVPAAMATEKKETVVEEKKTNPTLKKGVKKKDKRLNAKLYSRAALEREEFLQEVPAADSLKKDAQ